MKINKIRKLYKRFVESEIFKEVYKDKSVGEQMKIEEQYDNRRINQIITRTA